MAVEPEAWSLAWMELQSGLKERTIRSYIEQGLIPGAVGRGPRAYYSPRHLHRLLAIRKWREADGLGLEEVRKRLMSESDEAITGVAVSFDPRSAVAGLPAVPEGSSLLEYVRSVRGAGPQARSNPMAGPSVPMSAGQGAGGTNSPASGSPRAAPSGGAASGPASGVGGGGDPSALRVDGVGGRAGARAGEAGGAGKLPISMPPPGGWPLVPEADAMYAAGPSVPSNLRPRAENTPIGRMLRMVEGWRAAQSGVGQLTQPPRRAQGERWTVVRVTPDFEIRVRGLEDPVQVELLERLADELREALLGGEMAP